MKTGIIILCHNEANEIDTQIFKDFDRKCSDYHICFVNDRSSDNTLEVLKNVKASSPKNISIVNVGDDEQNVKAVTKGVNYLGSKKNVNYVGFVNANLSSRLMKSLQSF